MKLPSWIKVTLCLLSQSGSLATADDSVAEKCRFLAAGMRAEREKLRSGQVEMRGEHSHLSREFPNFRVPVRFRYDFDHTSRRYRHETRDYIPYDMNASDAGYLADEKANRDLPHGVTAKGIQWYFREVGGTTVHTPEYSLFKMCHARHVDRLPPGTPGILRIREMDVRVFGMTDWMLFAMREPFDSLINCFENVYSGPSIESDEHGVSHISFKPGGVVLLEIWVDELHGMTPIRLVRTELLQNNRVSSRSDVTWESKGGTWVPTSFMIRTDAGSESTEELALTLEWKTVNEPLDPKIFTAAGVAEGDNKIRLVADMTLGKMIIEPVIAPPIKVVLPKPLTANPPSRFWWIILANVIGVGVAWWFYRRRSRPVT